MLWNAAHFHMVLNHIPVIGAPIFLIILLTGIARKNLTLERTAYVGFMLLAVLSVPVLLTGLAAQDIVTNQIANSDYLIALHKSSAIFTAVGVILMGLWSTMAFVAGQPRNRFNVTSSVFAVIVCALLMWTAQRGGAINHPEIHSDHSVIPENSLSRQ